MQEARTVIDFGLLILIWVVQLIVYPSFKYADINQFASWHSQYSSLISFIVIPLMMSQAGIIVAQLFRTPNWSIWLAAVLVVAIWISTFSQAVPIHNVLQSSEIVTSEDLQYHASRLVSTNWIRTILWTLVFALGLVR